MAGAGMPGMGAGQPAAAAPLAQAESAADFNEQVICRKISHLTEYEIAIKGGKNEGDGHCR